MLHIQHHAKLLPSPMTPNNRSLHHIWASEGTYLKSTSKLRSLEKDSYVINFFVYFLNGFSSTQGNDFRLQGGRTNIKAGLKLTTELRVVTVRLATLLKRKCPDERYIGGLQMCFFFDGNLCNSWINENISEVRNNWNVLRSKADKDVFHIDTCLYSTYIYIYTYTHISVYICT